MTGVTGCVCVPALLTSNNKLSFTRIRAKAPNPCGTTRAYSGKNFFPIYAKACVRGTDLRQIAPNRKFELLLNDGDSGNHNNNNNNDGPHGGGGGDDYSNNGDDGEAAGSDPFDADYFLLLYSFTRTFSIKRLCDFFVKANKNLVQKKFALLLVSLLAYMAHTYTDSSTAFGEMGVNRKTVNGDEEVWEVKGSRWTKLLVDPFRDQFIVNGFSPSSSDKPGTHNVIEPFSLTIHGLLSQGKDLVLRLMLPEGYPDSVTSDYLDYSLWRGVQGIASQISGVLATQSLLYAVGLGKGAIPTAAAINWVLKDGIGYLSKIVLSKYGRHFDVNPKGWRLFADLLENAAFGLEILTPAFPHLFVFIGAVAGAGRSAASLIQAATRSCFYAGFAAKRNFAEVIAKGEAQGMVSKFVGIMLGIALANFTGSSTSLALATFGVITWIHMYCNLKSYQSIQLRSLNPYRASLIFSEYLLSGQVPSVTEVNAEEPLFPAIPWLNLSSPSQLASEGMSAQAKNAAAEIDRRLQLGAKLSTVIRTRDDAVALFDLYKHEGYILTEYQDNFFVVLKESATPLDMLKSIFQVNYLYWLEHNAGIKSRGTVLDCVMGGKLQLSLDYVRREFGHAKVDSELAGWVGDGLIARPAPNRVSLQLPR